MLKQMIRNTVNRLGYDIVRFKPMKPWPDHGKTIRTVYECSEAFHSLYNRAQRATQMTGSDNALRRMRHYTLNQLIHRVSVSHEADVCELGCFRGLSAYQIAYRLRRLNPVPTFHIFDSFEGLSELGAEDGPSTDGTANSALRAQFACSMADVKRNLKEYDFIRYHKGWIPDRFEAVEERHFSFVHIDVDLYQPIVDSIRFFYPRLITNGVMVFDDYGAMQFPGAKKAIDEFMQDRNDFFMNLPSGQAFLVKAGEGESV